MKKRILAAALMLIMAAMTILTGCNGGAPSGSATTAPAPGTAAPTQAAGGSQPAPQEPENNYEEEVVITSMRRSDSLTEVIEPLRDDMLKEKFNLVIQESNIPGSDFTTKMSTLFAAGMEPDFIWTVRTEWGGTEFAEAGYLKGFTKDELLNQYLPNYSILWDDEGAFDYLFNYLKHGDLLYMLPYARDNNANMAWTYRQDVFDKVGIEEFPATPDELYDVMLKIKNETGLVPWVDRSDAVIWLMKWGSAWGFPDLLPRMPAFENPINGNVYYYACATDDFREVVKYGANMYKDGLFWNEAITGTSEQMNAFIAEGNKVLAYGYPADSAKNNNLQVANTPDVDWTWTPVSPSIDPSKQVYKREPYHNANMWSFTYQVTDQQVERMCDWLNWAMTDEGRLFHSYGVEGVTYEVIDGVKTIKDDFATQLKPEGIALGQYQVGAVTKMHGDYLRTYLPVIAEVEAAFMGDDKYVFTQAPIMSYTEEENKQFVDVLTQLNDCRDEYLARFFSNELDPSNDEHWNRYISDMEKLGLREYEELNKIVYERSGN